eukprot:TRINITY_DN4860_c0_g1_i1.p1 TRINITY_DN4860_c0_g1~~TRINITY_DN4860_c0_g1_i1.p1  ORF type:complete len:2591 (-),score=801.00 TRINITY_DN4860_c0_g1_i1:32-7804(-)
MTGTKSNDSEPTTPKTPTPVDTKYRRDYADIENKCTHEADTIGQLNLMRERLAALMNESLTDDHRIFILTNALPKITKVLMKKKFIDDEVCNEVHQFTKVIVDVIIRNMSAGYIELYQALVMIMDNDNHFYLQKMIELPEDDEEEIYAITPVSNRWASHFLVEIINYFGRKGGFDAMFAYLGNPEPRAPIPHMAVLIEVLQKIQSNGYFPSSKLDLYINELRAVIMPRFTNLSPAELKALKKEDFDTLIKHTTKFLDSALTPYQWGEVIEKLQLSVALQCFQSSLLNKRIYGIQAINDTINMVRHTHREHHETDTIMGTTISTPTYGPTLPKETKWVDADFLVAWLQKNKVLEQIFGTSTHPEILKRSNDILGFMAKHNALSSENIDRIWVCATTVFEVYQSVVFKVLGDVCSELLPQHVEQFIQYIHSISKGNMTTTYLAFIKDLTRCRDPTQKAAMTELLWEFMIEEPSGEPGSLPLEIGSWAYMHLQEVVKNYAFRPHRWTWTLKCLKAIKHNKSPVFCWDLIGIIISTYPGKITVGEIEKETRIQMVEHLNREHRLLDIFFSEIRQFKDLALQIAASVVDKDRYNLNYMSLGGRLSFFEEISRRLKFLLFILQNFGEMLHINRYELLWECCIDDAITAAESDECYTWFIEGRKTLIPDTYVAIDDENAIQMFTRRILRMDPKTMTPVAFRLFTRYFCDTNIKKGRIMCRDSAKDDEFELNDLHPEGYTFIWKVLQEASHPEIVKEAMNFLIKLQDSISPHLIQSYGRYTLRDQFIRLCMSYLDAATQQYQSTQSNYEPVERLVSLLLTFCKHTEVQLGGKGYSHGSNTRGKPITLIITNSIPETQPTESFVLQAHSNETISAIKARIFTHITNFKGAVNDILLSIKRDQIQEEDRTIDEMGITNNQNIIVSANQKIESGQGTVMRPRVRNKTTESKPPPIDAEEKVKKLTEIFGIPPEASRIALKRTDWDVGNASTHLMEDSQKAEILLEAEKMIAENAEMAKNKRVDSEDIKRLPGHILASQESYFDKLFSLLLFNDNAISHRVWSLLLIIPTSKFMLEKIHSIVDDRNTKPNWESLFDTKSNFKLLYSLQIADSIIFPLEETQDISDRVLWCHNFLVKGGFHYLHHVLTTQDWFHDVNSNASDAPSERKSCMALILKILDFYIHLMLEDSSDPFLQQLKRSNIDTTAIVGKIDFASFMDKLMWIINDTARKANPDRADEEVVAYALRVVTLCVLFNPTVHLLRFYQFQNFDDFILTLLLRSPEAGIRAEAAGALSTLCSKLDIDDKSLSPHSKFLSFLLGYMKSHSGDFQEWSRCSQYFVLLEKLIIASCDGKDGGNVKDYHQLLIDLVIAIKDRPVVEFQQSDATDELLVGMMGIVYTLIKRDADYRIEVGSKYGLVQELYHAFLFKTGSGLPKCKTKTSRMMAFTLLVEVCRDSAQNYEELLSLLTPHHVGVNTQIKTWDYDPSSDNKAISGYVGLKNLGNTCYINALLQQFYMLPTLRNGILSVQQDTNKESLIKELQNTFGYLQASEKVCYAPQGLCQTYRDWDGRPINVHVQQDVDEFMNLLCQRIEDQLKGSPHGKLLSSIFTGKTSNEVRSIDRDYPYVSEREEDFYAISLDIKGKHNIGEALDAYVKGDKLEGDNAYYCDKYDRQIDATKRCCIKVLPNTLVLHLKRFEFDFTAVRKSKVHDYCEFPLVINMKPWTKEGLAIQDGIALEDIEEHDDSYYTYELMGVLVHTGGADAGHYYSYIKERMPSQSPHGAVEKRWFEFNDSVVTPFDPKDLPAECYGGTQEVSHWDDWSRQYVRKTYDRVRSAYMLFYDRVQPKDLGQDAKSPLLTHQKFIAELTNAANADGKQLMAGVPAQIHHQIQEENARFNRDRQLFDPTYFDFMLRVSQLCPMSSDVTEPIPHVPEQYLASYFDYQLKNDTVFKTIRLGTHFVIETLAHAKEAENYRPWISQLIKMYRKHVPSCQWFLCYAMETPNLIKELLLECSNEKVRIGFAELVGEVLKTLAPKEYEVFLDLESVVKRLESKSSSDDPKAPPTIKETTYHRPVAITVRFMDSVLDLLEDSRTYWRKFKQYFLVIKEWALQGWHERDYLFRKGVVGLYVDYFMGRPKKPSGRRVSVMDSFNLPDLTEFISTLSVLTRGCATGARREKGLPPTYLQDPNGPAEPIIMPAKEARELYDTTFFGSMLEMDYNTEAAIELICHVCWEDLKRSKYCLAMILAELSKTWHRDKLPTFKALLEPLLAIQDSLQNTRIITALSPFSAPNSNTKGILALIHDFHIQNSKFAFQLVKFVVHLAHSNEACGAYLAKQRKEMMWIEQFLEARGGLQTDHMSAGVDSDPDDVDDGNGSANSIVISNPAAPKISPDSTHLVLKSLQKFLAKCGIEEEPNFDKERELTEEIEQLRDLNNKLMEALDYYRKNSPNVPPPAIMLTREWEAGKPVVPYEDASTEDDVKSNGPMDDATDTMEPEEGSNQLPSDAPAKILQLIEIMGSFSEQLAILALKKADWDVEAVVSQVFTDDGFLEALTKELEAGESAEATNNKKRDSDKISIHNDAYDLEESDDTPSSLNSSGKRPNSQ